MPDQSSSLAVVTGGSAGIGRVFADRLARRGHPLLLIARNQSRLDQAAGELSRAYAVEVRTLSADLSTEYGIEEAAGALESEGDVGVLVNNAGFGTKGRIHEIDIEPQMQMLRLHALAPMRLARAVLPGMVARTNGWLINVSSIAGFMYGPGNANYCATKAYLTRFTQALDAELQGTGVRVQALCPGFTHSEFHERMRMDKRTVPAYLWMSADRVVDLSLATIGRDGAVVYIPGLKNKALTTLVRLLPHFLMRRGHRVGR
jgi:hypothetical protein